MDNEAFSAALSELKTDIKWIRQILESLDKKYAPYWVKYPVYAGTGGILFWALNQLLALIPHVKAIF